MTYRDELVPSHSQAVDMAFVLFLGAVSLLGFRTTFSGWSFLVAGLAGLLLGVLIGHVANAFRQPAIVLALLTVAAFFLLGGAAALRATGSRSTLPLPATLVTLADQSVNGWKELLTTLPPVDGGPLLTLPYLLGLVTGVCGTTSALRFRSAVIPVLWPLALLATVILLGVQTARDLTAVGGLFALGAVTWVVVRSHRLRTRVRIGKGHRRQHVSAGFLCAASVGAALFLSPVLPGVAEQRTVLREYVVPPFNVGQYGSPLASFRQYTKDYVAPRPDKKLYDKELFRVTGADPGTIIRIAALDSYNGTVWGAANDSGITSGSADTFRKVGSTLDNPTTGKTTTGTVTIDKGYAGVWLPLVGGLQRIEFRSSRLVAMSEDFRYNLASSTGIVPGGLQPGDSYRFEAAPAAAPLGKGTPVGQATITGTELGTRFQPLADEWAASADTPMARVLAVAAYLKQEGRYTNGPSASRTYPAGHSLKRLTDFVAPNAQIAGDDEQYAAMMALLANQLGVPARVVLGARLPEDGVVRGKNVRAWVELQAADGLWMTLPTSAFMDSTRPPDELLPQPQKAVAGKVIPPPAPVRPPSTAGDPVSDTLNQQQRRSDDLGGFPIPVWVFKIAAALAAPFLMAGLVASTIVMLKRRRAARRRMTGSTSDQIAGGWAELLDQLRDLGEPVHSGLTRREQAARVGARGIEPFANRADVGVFAQQTPSQLEVRSYWDDLELQRIEWLAALSKIARIRAMLSLASLRGTSPRGGS